MRQYLSAQIQATNQIELEEMVDAATMRNLKARDAHPEIRLYSIGHEGDANLHLPGLGTGILTWIQAAIQAIADKLEIGTAVFDRHNPDTNSHEGRTQIGEVVGKAVKKIGERLNTLAAIYVYPQFKSRPLDIASFEAEIEFDHNEHEAWPTNIRNVSGIALSNSGIDNPGFPGATLLGAVQAYVQAFEGEFGDNKMNQSDVKKAVSELGLTPSQLFGIDTIMGDAAVVGKVKEAKESVFNMSERVRQERDSARESVTSLENKNAEISKQLQQHTMQSRSVSVLDVVLADPERKLDDKAKIFVRRSHKNFTTAAENEDALKVDIVKFVEASVTEFGELAKDVFGVAVGNVPANNPLTFTLPDNLTVEGQPPMVSTPQTPPTIPNTREEVLQHEMNPDVNPLIPGGKAAAAEARKT